MAKTKPGDPAFWMLTDGVVSTPTVHNANCYICNDPEYSLMGLPLCYRCLVCNGHVPADDDTCDNGHPQPTCFSEEVEIREQYGLEVSDDLRQKAVLEVGG